MQPHRNALPHPSVRAPRTALSRPLAFQALLLMVALLVQGCGAPPRPVKASPRDHVNGAKTTESADKKDDEKDEDKAEDLRLDLAELHREHSIAATKHKGEAIEHGDELHNAELDLTEAKRDLEEFTKVKLPKVLAEQILKLDRAKERVHRTQKELDELKAMYDAEDFANMTKELVLHRGAKDLEFARRTLKLTETEIALERDGALPKKQRAFERKLQKTTNALRDKKHEQQILTMERALELMREKRAIQKLEKKLAKATKDNEPDDDMDK